MWDLSAVGRRTREVALSLVLNNIEASVCITIFSHCCALYILTYRGWWWHLVMGVSRGHTPIVTSRQPSTRPVMLTRGQLLSEPMRVCKTSVIDDIWICRSHIKSPCTEPWRSRRICWSHKRDACWWSPLSLAWETFQHWWLVNTLQIDKIMQS